MHDLVFVEPFLPFFLTLLYFAAKLYLLCTHLGQSFEAANSQVCKACFTFKRRLQFHLQVAALHFPRFDLEAALWHYMYAQEVPISCKRIVYRFV